ncbi:hypothetical protein [Aureibacter tunicatorum]|uniref:Uncharacterized protein n=1 Tax=Aureibacter tunicatorum TaxID=866807 RepID=A0AAE4BQA7_9BACT|nr:hypothetical protein [Aureibacter tunicatorum]MDR6238884.1 hypothetical protein [Aureibacter tunicatorum]BDD05189.1 hypothetical protein AUTU_26720 [Aureibacter tunicatorum]
MQNNDYDNLTSEAIVLLKIGKNKDEVFTLLRENHPDGQVKKCIKDAEKTIISEYTELCSKLKASGHSKSEIVNMLEEELEKNLTIKVFNNFELQVKSFLYEEIKVNLPAPEAIKDFELDTYIKKYQGDFVSYEEVKSLVINYYKHKYDIDISQSEVSI